MQHGLALFGVQFVEKGHGRDLKYSSRDPGSGIRDPKPGCTKSREEENRSYQTKRTKRASRVR
jgi:hypothetical protein